LILCKGSKVLERKQLFFEYLLAENSEQLLIYIFYVNPLKIYNDERKYLIQMFLQK